MSIDFTNIHTIGKQDVFLYLKASYNNSTVVLKALRQDFRTKIQYQKALKKEYEIGRQFQSEHILQYIGIEETTDYGTVVVLQYEEGRTLRDYIAENHSEEELLEEVSQLFVALREIHQKGFIHGNLNPDNIFVTQKNNQLKLFNFGIDTNDDRLNPGAIARYIAPEQRDGAIQLDARVDIYAVGMLLKDMGLESHYPHIVAQACSYSRNQRYADIDELETALEKGDHREFHFPKRLLVVLVVILLGAGLIALISSIASHPSGASDSLKDTVAQTAYNPDTVVVEKPDTAQVQATRLTLGLDSVYAPYIQERKDGMTAATNAQRKKVLTKQVKTFYMTLLTEQKQAEDFSQEQFDQQFADYKAKKDEEYDSCAPLK